MSSLPLHYIDIYRVNIDHGEHVAGVGGALLVAGGLLLLVEDPGHGQTEVGSEHVDKDCVTGIHCIEVVPADDLVDDEDDGLHDGHDDQLDGGGHSEHHSKGDEDSGGGEVSGDHGAHVDVDEGPTAITLVRAILYLQEDSQQRS